MISTHEEIATALLLLNFIENLEEEKKHDRLLYQWDLNNIEVQIWNSGEYLIHRVNNRDYTNYLITGVIDRTLEVIKIIEAEEKEDQ